jgi:hypothetical protein
MGGVRMVPDALITGDASAFPVLAEAQAANH